MIFSQMPSPDDFNDSDGLDINEVVARARAFLARAQAANHDDPSRTEAEAEAEGNTPMTPEQPPLCARCGAALAMPDVLPDDPVEPGRLCLPCWRLTMGRDAVQRGRYTDYPPHLNYLLARHPGGIQAELDDAVWRGLQRPNPWGDWDS